MNCWIRTISYARSTGYLRTLYDRVKGPDNNVDNVMKAHSLRPHTMEGHMTLYKYVLHHSANTVPKWFLEAIGVYVSRLNRCDYCVEHHFEGMRRLLGDDARATAMRAALDGGDLGAVFDAREASALRYAEALTLHPTSVTEAMIDDMRGAGFDDGEILEINQVAAYFAYANRTILGLGSTTEGDILGLSPSDADSPDDWSHT